MYDSVLCVWLFLVCLLLDLIDDLSLGMYDTCKEWQSI